MNRFTLLLLLGFSFITIHAQQDSTQTQDSVSIQTKEVVVKAKKPTIINKADRMVYNVENSSVLAGNNSWNILRMTPMLEIDNNGNISAGGSNAVVYINNRKSTLKGKDLEEYLKAMPAENIIKVEVITSPSARYDTDGPVINIVLNKPATDGVKGSLSFMNQMQQRNSQGISGNVNVHKNKFTQSFTYHLGGENYDFSSYDHNQIYAKNSDEYIYTRDPQDGFHIGGTATSEYELNDKNTIGLVLEYHQDTGDEDMTSTIDYFENKILLNSYNQQQINSRKNAMAASNVFYKYYDKEKNKSLDINFDWAFKPSDSDTRFYSYQTTTTGNNVISDEKNRNYSLKADYSQEIDSTGYTIEAGGKINFLNHSKPYVYNALGLTGDWVYDATRSNDFSYKENINSVYFNVSKQFFKKIDIRAGIRLENTNIETLQKTTDEAYDQSYNNWMPSLLVKYTINDKHNISLNYNQFFWRPFPSEYNPFLYPGTSGFATQGNPKLSANRYDNYELKYNFFKKYTFTFRYSFTDNDYWPIYVQTPNLIIQRLESLEGRVNKYGVNFNVNQNFFKDKLNINFNANYRYTDNSDFNKTNNIVADNYLSNYNFGANITYNDFLIKDLNFNAWVSYNSPNNFGNIIANNSNFYNVFSFTKIFKAIEMDAKIEFSNIFAQPHWDNSTYSTIGVFDHDQIGDWRGVSLSIVKRFGNQKIKATSKTEGDKERVSGGKK